MDGSLIAVPGRFATGRQTIANDLTVQYRRQVHGETSREVAKLPGIETSKGTKRPGGQSSMNPANYVI